MSDTSSPDNSINKSIADYIEVMSLDQQGLLRDISLTLRDIARQDGLMISQSSLRDLADATARADRQRVRSGAETRENSRGNTYGQSKRGQDQDAWRHKSAKNLFDDALDDFEKQFKTALFGAEDPIVGILSKSLSGLANSMGVSVDKLGGEFGKMAGEAFKGSKIGGRLTKEWNSILNGVSNSIGNMTSGLFNDLGAEVDLSGIIDTTATVTDMASGMTETVGAFTEMGSASAEVAGAMGGVAAGAGEVGTALAVTGTEVAASGAMAGAGLEAAGMAAAEAGMTIPGLNIAIIAGIVALDIFTDTLGPAAEGLKAFVGVAKESSSNIQSRNAYELELYKKRIKADSESIIQAAYNVITQAADKAMETWDAILTTVTATQGYDKAGVQELWSNYAERLKNEGLSSVISSADMMQNLESVLKQGLSGQVAEEFAYMATVLTNAVPTEDFFQYASTYASIAANAIKNGQSQDEAIQTANAELEAFASNLLYASREVAGGFTTSLQGASDLFAQANKIATASRVGNVSSISGVLTSVSAIVGAIAPDLAGSVVDAVVSAATGGNSSELTALRSMAGTGASNTAFLQALARDPQKVFASLFSNLAQLQNMSASNYMEVAEGLSQVFGMSMDAFARVDFAYLADAINAMNVNNNSLAENMELLASGQTKATAEQLKMQQINQYMIDEGLAYVLDNEVAREVQRHMWEEELNRELKENEYAVNLQGAALELLQGLSHTVEIITNLLNPKAWLKGVDQLVLTALEGAAIHDDLNTIIEQGKVGTGNESIKKMLTTQTASDFKLTSYLSMMGQASAVDAIKGRWDRLAEDAGLNYNVSSQAVDLAGDLLQIADTALMGTAKSKIGSRSTAGSSAKRYYNWSVISKSLSSAALSGDWRTDASYDPTWAQAQIAKTSQSAIEGFMATAASAVEKGMTYQEWASTASQHGIQNLAQALSDFGRTETDMRSYFESEESQQAAKEIDRRNRKEEEFWDDMMNYVNEYFPDHFEKQFLTNWKQAWETNYLDPIKKDLNEFLTVWKDYYIAHTAYTQATSSAYAEAMKVNSTEKGETSNAVLALAEALTDGNNIQDLKDPVVQTNVLLAKILIVAESIMQQNNETSIVSVPTALSSLGLGITQSSSKKK